MNRMKEFLKKDFHSVLNLIKSRKSGNLSALQTKSRKLLAGFFIMMILLTILSRISDSITLAKVKTINPGESSLTFVTEGTGTVTADVIKYIEVQEGLRVNKIHIRAGQEVKAGDVILEFNPDDIEDALDNAKSDVERLNIQMEQAELSGSDIIITGYEKAEMTYDNAVQDLADAKEDLKRYQEKYKLRKADYEDAEVSYEEAFIEKQEELYTASTDNYLTAKADYEEASLTNEELLRSANRKVDDARGELEELNSEDNSILEALERYSSNLNSDWQESQKALEDLFIISYGGGKEEYEAHKDEVGRLKDNITYAEDELDAAEHSYEQVKNTPVDLVPYEKAVSAAKRQVKEAEHAYDSATAKETNIRAAVSRYHSARISSDNSLMESAKQDLFEAIYGVGGYREHKKAVADAAKQLTYAEEDRDTVKKKNEITLTASGNMLDKSKKAVDSIDEGTYNYDRVDIPEKQELEAAEQELDAAGLTVESAEDKVNVAERAAESAKYDLEQAKKQDSKTMEAQTQSDQNTILSLEAIRLDMREKQELLESLEELKVNKGTVKSMISGTVESIGLETGRPTDANSTITVSSGGYGVLAVVTKEEGEYVSIGSKMTLTEKGTQQFISVKVEGIHFTLDESGNTWTEITAALPEGDYMPGATLGIKISKMSEMYNCCVPITAIREDSDGTFVLVAGPRETILGEEYAAVREPVEIIDMDATMAAVSGSISRTDKVIISSNKNIREGDRVRPN